MPTTPKQKKKEKKAKNDVERILQIIDNRIALWLGHATEGQLASPYSHLTLVGELEVIKDTIKNHLKLKHPYDN